jgi:hypothetical protein
MKINAGCGYQKLDGWVNVDSDPQCKPDVVWELDKEFWGFADDDDDPVDEVLFNHSLEHMGELVEEYHYLISELYRVCAPDALVRINCPNPFHEDFVNDPTHVRAITPASLSLLSKRNNAYFRENKAANTCLADMWDVDFEMVSVERVVDPRFPELVDQPAVFEKMALVNLNIVKEYKIVLKAVK